MESCRCTSAHHVASSPWATVTANSGPQEAETDLARLQSSKGIRALERLHRRTRTAGGRSHHTLRRGGNLGGQAEVAGNRRPGHRALPFALTASVGASAAPYLPTRGRAEPGRLRASPRRSPPPARAGHRSPVWAAGPGGGGPAGAKPRKRAERFSGRVIGAPWRSRELAATATGAATALRTATQRLMVVKYKKRKLPPAVPFLQFQDKIAATQEINQTLRPCCGLTTASVWPGNAVRNETNS